MWVQVGSTVGGLKALQQQMASLKLDSEARSKGHLDARERLVGELEHRYKLRERVIHSPNLKICCIQSKSTRHDCLRHGCRCAVVVWWEGLGWVGGDTSARGSLSPFCACALVQCAQAAGVGGGGGQQARRHGPRYGQRHDRTQVQQIHTQI